MTAWIIVLVSFLRSIYFEFKIFRTQKLYDVNFTGQTMYLQKKLRDKFGCPDLYIADGTRSFPLYMANKNENSTPVYLGNTFVLGAIYVAGEEVIYNNRWYIYTASGNGGSPDIDPNTVPSSIHSSFVFNTTELLTEGNFIIYIPNSCYIAMSDDTKNQLKSIVNFYILADKTYKIITF